MSDTAVELVRRIREKSTAVIKADPPQPLQRAGSQGGAQATKAKQQQSVDLFRGTQYGPPVPSAAPGIRRGESALTSRPYSYLKHFQLMYAGNDPDAYADFRVEHDVEQAFVKAAKEYYPGWTPLARHSVIPLSLTVMPGPTQEAVKAAGYGGTMMVDKDELDFIREATGSTKAMGTFNYQLGGSLVPHPAYGDLIRLARNTPSLLGAGATPVALPPQGSEEFPRIATPTAVTAVSGEGDDASETELGTDSVLMQAKMISGIVTMSNRLLMQAGVAAEGVVQEDLTLSTILRADYDGLFGTGGVNILGLLPQLQQIVDSNNSPTQRITLSVANNIQPQDFGEFWTLSAQANRAQIGVGILMPPRTYKNFMTARANAIGTSVATGVANAGQFVMANPFQSEFLNQIKYHWTNQIPIDFTSGNTNTYTYVFGGTFPDLMFGSFGAVQALLNPFETDAYKKNFTKIRITGLFDIGIRYPKSFGYAELVAN